MAVIDSKGRLHGRVGNVVYRTIGNTMVVQSTPGKVKQTLSTKESALEFGLVSNCGRILRELYSTFACYSDGRLLNRMNAALLKILRDSDKQRGERDLHDGNPKHLEGLQFNVNSPLTEALTVRPVCRLEDQVIKVQIPAFKEHGRLNQLRYSRHCVLRVMVGAINFREGYYEYLDYKDIPVEWGAITPGQEWVSEVALPAGSIVLVTASLHYFGMKDINGEALSINSKEYSPAEVIGAYSIAAEAQSEASAEDSVAKDMADQKRYPLTNYRGKEILNEIVRKRKRDKKYQNKLAKGQEMEAVSSTVVDSMKMPTGKVYYKKE